MSELDKKQITYWKRCFEEVGLKYKQLQGSVDKAYVKIKLRNAKIKKLEEENKLLTMCQCGEFDIEFNRHCNSCVKDRIEKLENAVTDASKIFKYVKKEEIPDVSGCAQWLEKYPIGDAPTYLTIREVEKLETKLFDAEKVINNTIAALMTGKGTIMEVRNKILSLITEYRNKYGEGSGN